MNLAATQRQQLCDLLLDLGPLAPTECEGWRAQDLAAHLWVREHRADALPGIGLKRFAGRTDQVQAAALHRHGFQRLVGDLRRPGVLMRPLDGIVNVAELTIHHLDLARANGRVVVFTDAEQKQLWRYASMFGRMTARGFGGRLMLEPTGLPQLAIGTGDRPVHLVGAPSELLFFLSGRTGAANVELIGDDDAVAKLKDSIRGL